MDVKVISVVLLETAEYLEYQESITVYRCGADTVLLPRIQWTRVRSQQGKALLIKKIKLNLWLKAPKGATSVD